MIKEMFDEKRSKQVLDFMYCCYELNSDADFRELMQVELPKLIPHEMAMFGYGRMDTRQALKLININYPADYLSGLTHDENRPTIHSPLLEIVLQKKSSVYIRDMAQLRAFSEHWWDLVCRNDIRDTLICGMPVRDDKEGCTASLANCDIEESEVEKSEMTMNLLLPYIHKAIIRIYEIPRGDARVFKLTPKELELLDAIRSGCSNKEIAGRFEVSVHTVRNRLHTIYEKLGVNTRTEAINKAQKAEILPD